MTLYVVFCQYFNVGGGFRLRDSIFGTQIEWLDITVSGELLAYISYHAAHQPQKHVTQQSNSVGGCMGIIYLTQKMRFLLKNVGQNWPIKLGDTG